MTFLVTHFIAQQGTRPQRKAGTDGRLREATAWFLVTNLRPHLLILCCIWHADTGAVNDNNPSIVERISIWVGLILKLLYRVKKDGLQCSQIKPLSRLAVRCR